MTNGPPFVNVHSMDGELVTPFSLFVGLKEHCD